MGLGNLIGKVFGKITGLLASFDPISFLINTAVSWVVGELIADEVQQDIDDRYSGVLVNKQSNIAQIPVIYGERKVGGTRVFVSTGGEKNKYLYVVLVLCEGEVDSIGDVYINDVISSDSRYAGLITIQKHLGSDDQTASGMLIGGNVGWTAAHRLRGIAYLAMRFEWNQDVFGGVPNVTAIVRGRKVYDPRTGSTAYSTNPALCLRDYLTNARFGKGLAASAVDDTAISAAANKCDTLVTPYNGASQQKLFECNTVLDTSRRLLDNTKVLLSGMRGILPYRDGAYSLIVEDQGTSVFSFNSGNMMSDLAIQAEKKSNKYNRVIATFADPDSNWQLNQIEYPPAGSALAVQYLADDGLELVGRVDLQTVTDIYMAEDLAEIILERSRQSKIVAFTATSEALKVTVGDIVDITHATPAWTAKPFRVASVGLNIDGTVDIEAVEHQDSIYPWVSKSQAPIIPDTNLPDPYGGVAKPGVPSVAENLYITKSGAGVKARVALDWAEADDIFVQEYEAEYKLTTATSYSHIGRIPNTDAEVLDIAPGIYTFRVRALSVVAKSDWSETDPIEVFGLSTPPAALANVELQSVSSLAVIEWDQSTDLDVRIGGKVEIRHSILTVGASWSDSVSLGKALPGEATQALLPLLPGTYLLRAVDSSDIYSPVATVVAEGATALAYSSVGTVTEHPTFGGTFTDCYLDGGRIELIGADTIDDWADFDAVTDFDIGEDGNKLLGYYKFSAGIDAGVVKRQQLVRTIKSSVVNDLDLFDERAANIDDWADFDGIDTSAGDCRIFVRYTDDDPTGSPTWSAWELLKVNEYNHRAFEFRAELTVDDPAYNIEISELSVTAQEVA